MARAREPWFGIISALVVEALASTCVMCSRSWALRELQGGSCSSHAWAALTSHAFRSWVEIACHALANNWWIYVRTPLFLSTKSLSNVLISTNDFLLQTHIFSQTPFAFFVFFNEEMFFCYTWSQSSFSEAISMKLGLDCMKYCSKYQTFVLDFLKIWISEISRK